MGQYYLAVIVKEGEVHSTFEPHDYKQGAKLMEHSYYVNSITRAVMFALKDNKELRLGWVGDYADEHSTRERNEQVYTREQIEEFSKASKKDLSRLDYNWEPRFIVNHTKQEFIDLKKLHDYFDYIFDEDDSEKYEEDMEGEYINPLPLLTSYAGSGGGDYRKNNINESLVGTWAFDIIGVYENFFPENYKEFEYVKRKRP